MILLPLLGACKNVFLPEVEEKGAEYYDPVKPEYVVKNLEIAYTSKDIEAYRRCLDVDSFVFYFDPSQSDIKDILRERWGIDSLVWGYNEEIRSAEQIFSYADEILLSLTNGSPIEEGEATSTWVWDYYLRIDPPYEGSGYASGRAVFTFVKKGEYWYIRKWQDFRSGR